MKDKPCQGHINAGRVDRSARLTRIIEVLKEAAYPLSAQEIAIRAYDFAASGKVMLNVSTNIGELRARVNRELGYVVSEAEMWRGDRYPWQDGRHRYRLLAAPGWSPRWTVNQEGIHVLLGQRQPPPAQSGKGSGAVAEPSCDVRTCKKCGASLPADGPPFCSDECKAAWFESLQSRLTI
ncbi:MAG: hypothetical protein M0R70_14700 [Nitrospirae bacterium]|nr:hypothetical protein [Nitrospirota bacterium]